jgi:hypothetical protein
MCVSSSTICWVVEYVVEYVGPARDGHALA